MDIYLDQNHFIALARVFHGREKEPGVVRAGSRIIDAARKGQARLPLSRIHLLEATKISDRARRERLIDAFIALSGGWVVKPVESLTAEELLDWMRGGAGRATTAIRRGLLSAFATYETAAAMRGVAAGEIAAVDFFGDSPAAWRFVLKDSGLRNALVPIKAIGYASRVESVRQEWSALPADRRILAYAEGLFDDTVASLQPLTDDLRTALGRLDEGAPEELPQRLRRIPTLDVLFALGEARARDKSKVTDPNDLWDLGFLPAAIPYFDIVVTERSWSHLVKTTGLAGKYECRVVAKLEDVLELLKTPL